MIAPIEVGLHRMEEVNLISHEIGELKEVIRQLRQELADTHKRYAEEKVAREADELREHAILADEVVQRFMTSSGRAMSDTVELDCETDTMPYTFMVGERKLRMKKAVYRWD